MLPSRQDTFVGLWRKLVDNLSTRAGPKYTSDPHDGLGELVAKATANLGAALPTGPFGARLRDLVTASATVSTQNPIYRPTSQDTEGELYSKFCYNLGGGFPQGSQYDRLYASVLLTHS